MFSRLSYAELAQMLAASERLLAEADGLKLTDKQRKSYTEGVEKAVDKLKAELKRREKER